VPGPTADGAGGRLAAPLHTHRRPGGRPGGGLVLRLRAHRRRRRRRRPGSRLDRQPIARRRLGVGLLCPGGARCRRLRLGDRARAARLRAHLPADRCWRPRGPRGSGGSVLPGPLTPGTRTDRERGATAILVAGGLVFLMAFAWLAIVAGLGFDDRRGTQ